MSQLAAQFQRIGELALIRKEIPELGDHDVLVKIDTATICGTDIHILAGHQPAKPPVVIGHEFSGYVASVGKAVRTVQPGDLVTVEPHIFCGVCKYCRIGKEHLCLNKLAFGVHLDGGFQEYCAVPEKTVYRVPASVSPSVAALTENIGCCLHGVDRAGVSQGDHVVIFGGGFVGIALAELVRLRGASRILVAEPNGERRRILERRGFQAINPLEADVNEAVRELTNGLGADLAIEAAGRKETAQQCFEVVGRGGTILFFGVVPPEHTIEVEPNDIFRRELTVVGSAINPYAHHRAIQMLDKLNLDELITHRFPLDRIGEAFETARRGIGIKIAIQPSGGA
jgi:2-desacetyl-2-hydroxyethyl bacteriochlorophyllide A dehydrogenase